MDQSICKYRIYISLFFQEINKYIRYSCFYYRGLRNYIELIKIAISILNSTQFLLRVFIRSRFVSICVCVCAIKFSLFRKKMNGGMSRGFLSRYIDIIKRGGERDPPETTRLRRPHWPQMPLESVFRENRNRRRNRRFKGSKRSTKSKLSIEFHWSVVDRNHSFECNQRCSQMRCQSGMEETKVSCYFSFFFFSFFNIYISTIEQSRKRIREGKRRSNTLFYLSRC